jgi:hypothetical protein
MYTLDIFTQHQDWASRHTQNFDWQWKLYLLDINMHISKILQPDIIDFFNFLSSWSIFVEVILGNWKIEAIFFKSKWKILMWCF